MVCRGICSSMETKGINGHLFYMLIEQGFRVCRGCDCMIKFPGIYCPCCGLRTTIIPRRSKYKMKMRVYIK